MHGPDDRPTNGPDDWEWEWDGRWDADLVRCRLWAVGDVLRRLPRVGGPAGVRSAWPEWVRDAELAYGYNDEEVRDAPPDAEGIDVLDRTMRALETLTVTRRVLAFGAIGRRSARQMERALKRTVGATAMGRTRLLDEQRRACEILAARWNGSQPQAMDAETLRRRRRELWAEAGREGAPIAPAVERAGGVLVSR